jgi:site-specific recombinase XerD
LTDAVEKGFWAGAASNIDSKRASSAQDRFKKSATMILLLRAEGTPQTFSTASTQSRLNARGHGYQRMVARVGEAAGFPVPDSLAMLRHSCGYKLANDGRETRAIQGYAGHRSIVSTQR